MVESSLACLRALRALQCHYYTSHSVVESRLVYLRTLRALQFGLSSYPHTLIPSYPRTLVPSCPHTLVPLYPRTQRTLIPSCPHTLVPPYPTPVPSEPSKPSLYFLPSKPLYPRNPTPLTTLVKWRQLLFFFFFFSAFNYMAECS